MLTPFLYLASTAVASFALGIAVATEILGRAGQKRRTTEQQSRVLYSHVATLQAWLLSDLSHDVMTWVSAGDAPPAETVEQTFELVTALQGLIPRAWTAPDPGVIHALGILVVELPPARDGLHARDRDASDKLRRDVEMLLNRVREQENNPR